MSALIDRLERKSTLYRAENFVQRMQALDLLELHTLDDSALFADAEQPELMQRAGQSRQKLADANDALFAHLLQSVRAGDRAAVYRTFRRVDRQIARDADDDLLGYDELDMLANGLLEVASVPEEPDSYQSDMVFYQPTPARVILRLIDVLRPSKDDLLYDLGSGLGHVPILVNLLTGIRTCGIELQDAYYRYSVECLDKLALPDTTFIHADARDADYSAATIFYLYTPFQGEILQQVLRQLQAQSAGRAIRICAYGPCVLEISRQPWLRATFQAGRHEGRLAIFTSL